MELYTIGETASITGIPVRTLRFYDEQHLLKPEKRDVKTNYRYYTEKQLSQALRIKILKKLGLSLDDISIIINQKDTEILEEKLKNKILCCEDELERLNHQLISNRYLYKQLLDCRILLEEKIKYTQTLNAFTVEFFPITWVLSTRYQSKINVETLFSQRVLELLQILDQHQLFPVGPVIGIFYDGFNSQFITNKGDLEVCLPIIKLENIKCKELKVIGDFNLASIIHIGHYKDSYNSYISLLEWIQQNNYKIIGPPMEIYLIDPCNVSDSNYYVTKIGFPIEQI